MNVDPSILIAICAVGGFLIVWLVMPWKGSRGAAADGDASAPHVPTKQNVIVLETEAKTPDTAAPEGAYALRTCRPTPLPNKDSPYFRGSGARLQIPVAVFLVPAAFLAIALGQMPYGYYQLLKLVVTGAAIWIAVGSFWSRGQTFGILFGVIALAYNPVFPIRFNRETWNIVNIATIIALLAGLGISRLGRQPLRNRS